MAGSCNQFGKGLLKPMAPDFPQHLSRGSSNKGGVSPNGSVATNAGSERSTMKLGKKVEWLVGLQQGTVVCGVEPFLKATGL